MLHRFSGTERCDSAQIQMDLAEWLLEEGDETVPIWKTHLKLVMEALASQSLSIHSMHPD